MTDRPTPKTGTRHRATEQPLDANAEVGNHQASLDVKPTQTHKGG